MLEDVADGPPRAGWRAPPLAERDIDRLYDRYQNVYGQPGHPPPKGRMGGR
ncbi:MAG: hypothetical protein IPH03_09875 [Tetrasphaera sp.]|nr:hypothetical protein [Tetrasphaera sp.]